MTNGPFRRRYSDRAPSPLLFSPPRENTARHEYGENCKSNKGNDLIGSRSTNYGYAYPTSESEPVSLRARARAPRKRPVVKLPITEASCFKYSRTSISWKNVAQTPPTKEQRFSDSRCSCTNTVRLARYIRRDIVISSGGKHDFY